MLMSMDQINLNEDVIDGSNLQSNCNADLIDASNWWIKSGCWSEQWSKSSNHWLDDIDATNYQIESNSIWLMHRITKTNPNADVIDGSMIDQRWIILLEFELLSVRPGAQRRLVVFIISKSFHTLILYISPCLLGTCIGLDLNIWSDLCIFTSFIAFEFLSMIEIFSISMLLRVDFTTRLKKGIHLNVTIAHNFLLI